MRESASDAVSSKRYPDFSVKESTAAVDMRRSLQHGTLIEGFGGRGKDEGVEWERRRGGGERWTIIPLGLSLLRESSGDCVDESRKAVGLGACGVKWLLSHVQIQSSKKILLKKILNYVII